MAVFHFMWTSKYLVILPSLLLWYFSHSFQVSIYNSHQMHSYCYYFKQTYLFGLIKNTKKFNLYFFSDILPLFMWLCFWPISFSSAKRKKKSPNTSCRAGLLMVNTLSFYLYEKIFNFNFTGYKILDFHFFVCWHLKYFTHFLLVVWFLWEVYYNSYHFPSR